MNTHQDKFNLDDKVTWKNPTNTYDAHKIEVLGLNLVITNIWVTQKGEQILEFSEDPDKDWGFHASLVQPRTREL